MQMQRKILFVVALAALFPIVATAQTEPEAHQHGKMMTSGEEAPMPECCQEMMARHQEMQEHMKARDAKLDRLLEEMRAATGDAKVAATAAVVEELVAQHRSMHAMMMKHQPMMMRQMMGSMGSEGSKPACQCPMMEGMGTDADHEEADEEEAGDGHSDHHNSQ